MRARMPKLLMYASAGCQSQSSGVYFSSSNALQCNVMKLIGGFHMPSKCSTIRTLVYAENFRDKEFEVERFVVVLCEE